MPLKQWVSECEWRRRRWKKFNLVSYFFLLFSQFYCRNAMSNGRVANVSGVLAARDRERELKEGMLREIYWWIKSDGSNLNVTMNKRQPATNEIKIIVIWVWNGLLQLHGLCTTFRESRKRSRNGNNMHFFEHLKQHRGGESKKIRRGKLIKIKMIALRVGRASESCTHCIDHLFALQWYN